MMSMAILPFTRRGHRRTLQREAQAWLVRLTSGRVTEADGAAFRCWCAQSPEHARAFAQARQVWQKMQPAARQIAGRVPASRSWAGRAGRRAFLGGAVTAATAYLLVRPPLGLWPGLTEWQADYRTGTGEQRQLTLAGGLQVELNTQTRINVQQGQAMGGVVGIELVAGEAEILTAARAGGEPMCQVLAGPGRITAMAARFNVRYTDAKVYVSCLQGEVSVESGPGGAPVRLLASQQLSYDDAGHSTPMPIDGAQVSAWRQRMLVFNGVPLAAVIEELNRYRRGRIVLTDPALGRNPVQAHFSLDRLDEAIALIRDVYGASITQLPGGIVLVGQGRA